MLDAEFIRGCWEKGCVGLVVSLGMDVGIKSGSKG